MLEIHQFQKTYPTGFKINIESLNIGQGIHLVKGENGAGKSTLFKAIAGIHPFEGEILVDKLSVKKEPLSYRKFVNYSESEPQYPEFLSLEELILFVSEAKKATQTQIDLLKKGFGVGSYSNNTLSSYSSGMLKKAGLLLAFLGHPKLIILDEPFTTIDTASQKNLIQLINSEMARGVDFLISSHHIAPGEFLNFTSILTISNGTILQKQ